MQSTIRKAKPWRLRGVSQPRARVVTNSHENSPGAPGNDDRASVLENKHLGKGEPLQIDPQRGLPRALVEQLAHRSLRRAGIRNFPNLHVVQNVEELPAYLRYQLETDRATETTRAIFEP